MVSANAEALPRSLRCGPTKGVGPSVGMTARRRNPRAGRASPAPTRARVRYQGMRWIRPTRIRTAAANEIRTAHVSREMRGADLVWELVLLILLLLLSFVLGNSGI